MCLGNWTTRPDGVARKRGEEKGKWIKKGNKKRNVASNEKTSPLEETFECFFFFFERSTNKSELEGCAK